MWLGTEASEEVEPFRVSLKNNFERLWPHLGLGVTVGCFMGGGYGLAIGFGTLKCLRRTQCVVVPSTSPFVHSGYLSGAFCGIGFGSGFGAGIARGIGYAWSLKQLNPFPKRLDGKKPNVSVNHLCSLPTEFIRWIYLETKAFCKKIHC
ncbi:hypothetical protein Gasu2_22500 [Galdieria sulphuraria]|uniref:Uncharacterized protein n=1 Tax=Galdieria sulphuraria TaxID=130081 RepID=M2X840_GALSU|nr:hypothetical protein Gasu_00900 isoform 1 [Galdieria sulphuraria]EME32725.1 hypothetical protein Gasu_00900 isoform 1 [Galdieria sulphuraria]GJD07926.1 hypothetical protein Gasu2_22500 [Galdieria sulphuraria]|eukprot:XP_005709245.1 hypothetical protein isoform 1 [Galdieria sulphuraria]